MGFSLDLFFDNLKELLEADMKPAKKIKALNALVWEAYRYAKVCGQVD